MTSPSTDRRFASNSSLAIKAPCRVASTSNITLSGLQSIDGITVAADDRVLVKDQTTASENGIYIADTSTWNRAPDFDGDRDIAKGTLVRVNEGTNNAASWFSVSSEDDITVGTDDITFAQENLNFTTAVYQTASAGQTLVNLGTSYQSGQLAVFVNGLRIRSTDYTETSSTSITLGAALQEGDEIDVYVGTPSGSLTLASASAASVADAGDYYVGTTVEAVLQEIAYGVTADNGDADKTLTYNSSDRVQRWNTALTANRTATLSTSNAKEGANFIVVRGAGATGNFTLTVGSLATLRAPGSWCEVRYDAGTWILEKEGLLSAAEVRSVTDNGDADATLTVGSSSVTQRWTTALTEDRTATLSATSVWAGSKFVIVRPEATTGAFALIVVSGSTRLARLGPGQWCVVEHNGSAWAVTGLGNLRQNQTSMVELRDDFLGEEIDGYKWQSIIGTDAECQAATIRADQIGGVIRITTGDDASASMAVNGVQVQSRLNWKANQGCLSAEFRVAIDTITNVAVFVGLTDQVSALEMPFTLGAGDALTSNATDAVGVLFDTGADTDNWWLVGVAADVDATKQDAGVAPAAATFETWRIEVDSPVSGATTCAARFYRNNSLVGSAMSDAVTGSVALSPVIAAFSRTSASRNIDADLFALQAIR